LGLPPLLSFTIATLGVITLSLLLPPLLPWIDRAALAFAKSRIGFLSRIGSLYLSIVERTRKKASPYTDKYGVPGIIVFVAIPLPGTGIWTGSLAAYLLGIEKHKTFLALLTGGIISNIITFAPTLLVH
jgi:uncharacterized membrane protein